MMILPNYDNLDRFYLSGLFLMDKENPGFPILKFTDYNNDFISINDHEGNYQRILKGTELYGALEYFITDLGGWEWCLLYEGDEDIATVEPEDWEDFNSIILEYRKLHPWMSLHILNAD